MLDRLIADKILIVIRNLDEKESTDLCNILLENDVKFVEVSFSDEGADKVLKTLKSHFDGRLFLGAGTVFEPENYRKALLSGADYILSPGLSLKIAELSKKDQIPYIPGVFTPTDVQNAMEMGFSLLKLYPADLGLLKSYRGPFAKVRFMPFGGITDENVVSYFVSGAVAVGIGTYIANKRLLMQRNFTELAMRIRKIKQLIGGLNGPVY